MILFHRLFPQPPEVSGGLRGGEENGEARENGDKRNVQREGWAYPTCVEGGLLYRDFSLVRDKREMLRWMLLIFFLRFQVSKETHF